VVAALIYIVTMFTFIPVPSLLHLWYGEESGLKPRLNNLQSTGESNPSFPHDRLAEFLSALLSIVSMILLGFADDIFDLRWRHKLLLPTVASLPLLTVYFSTFGVTSVVVPSILRPLLGLRILDLGPLYYVYMSMLAIFLTNCINILAGVNGVEVAQSIVVALSIIVNDLYTIFFVHDARATQAHTFSFCLLLPFVAVSFGLLRYNWFPARVFVGDTYTYFAGMTFAVVGILGHFSKTVLLFFVPQIVNFILSLPQLARIVPCPRHRLPRCVVHSHPIANEKKGLTQERDC
jgi:UDP-N-acetylglucosamine--dolichyl-phosphate N-acetylglucosaminephosphotransferase